MQGSNSIKSGRTLKSVFLRGALLLAPLFLAACQTDKHRFADVSQAPAVRETGWRVGTTYRTRKIGAVANYFASPTLETPAADGRVRAVLENQWPHPKPWFLGVVPIGSRFRVEEIVLSTTSSFETIHVRAKPLDCFQNLGLVRLDWFGEITDRDTAVGSLRPLDRRYLKPVE